MSKLAHMYYDICNMLVSHGLKTELTFLILIAFANITRYIPRKTQGLFKSIPWIWYVLDTFEYMHIYTHALYKYEAYIERCWMLHSPFYSHKHSHNPQWGMKMNFRHLYSYYQWVDRPMNVQKVWKYMTVFFIIVNNISSVLNKHWNVI